MGLRVDAHPLEGVVEGLPSFVQRSVPAPVVKRIVLPPWPVKVIGVGFGFTVSVTVSVFVAVSVVVTVSPSPPNDRHGLGRLDRFVGDPRSVVVTRSEEDIVVDIIDPHRPDSSDTAPKWGGLAAYAKEHSSLVRRINAIIADDDGELLSLDLKNPHVAKRLESASNEADIRKIFADFGGALLAARRRPVQISPPSDGTGRREPPTSHRSMLSMRGAQGRAPRGTWSGLRQGRSIRGALEGTEVALDHVEHRDGLGESFVSTSIAWRCSLTSARSGGPGRAMGRRGRKRLG